MNGQGNRSIRILRLKRGYQVGLKQEYQRRVSVASMVPQDGLARPVAKHLNIENQCQWALISGIQISNDLGSWDPLGYQSSAGCRRAILNFEFAMPGQSHLRRCDQCQRLWMGCQIF